MNASEEKIKDLSLSDLLLLYPFLETGAHERASKPSFQFNDKDSFLADLYNKVCHELDERLMQFAEQKTI